MHRYSLHFHIYRYIYWHVPASSIEFWTSVQHPPQIPFLVLFVTFSSAFKGYVLHKIIALKNTVPVIQCTSKKLAKSKYQFYVPKYYTYALRWSTWTCKVLLLETLLTTLCNRVIAFIKSMRGGPEKILKYVGGGGHKNCNTVVLLF